MWMRKRISDSLFFSSLFFVKSMVTNKNRKKYKRPKELRFPAQPKPWTYKNKTII